MSQGISKKNEKEKNLEATIRSMKLLCNYLFCAHPKTSHSNKIYIFIVERKRIFFLLLLCCTNFFMFDTSTCWIILSFFVSWLKENWQGWLENYLCCTHLSIKKECSQHFLVLLNKLIRTSMHYLVTSSSLSGNIISCDNALCSNKSHIKTWNR